jgi:hypothetical protein
VLCCALPHRCSLRRPSGPWGRSPPKSPHGPRSRTCLPPPPPAPAPAPAPRAQRRGRFLATRLQWRSGVW